MDFPILTLLTFLPILATVILLFIKNDQQAALKNVALISSLAIFLLSLPLYFSFENRAGMHL